MRKARHKLVRTAVNVTYETPRRQHDEISVRHVCAGKWLHQPYEQHGVLTSSCNSTPTENVKARSMMLQSKRRIGNGHRSALGWATACTSCRACSLGTIVLPSSYLVGTHTVRKGHKTKNGE